MQCHQFFFIPNVFTPNHDGYNDYFKPLLFGTVKQYYLVVYNRWGQTVFQTTDRAKGWGGLYKGKEQNNDVFVWMCRYQLEGEQVKIQKGTVVLVR
jgi:gliding motility-associated-like protein